MLVRRFGRGWSIHQETRPLPDNSPSHCTRKQGAQGARGTVKWGVWELLTRTVTTVWLGQGQGLASRAGDRGSELRASRKELQHSGSMAWEATGRNWGETRMQVQEASLCLE